MDSAIPDFCYFLTTLWRKNEARDSRKASCAKTLTQKIPVANLHSACNFWHKKPGSIAKLHSCARGGSFKFFVQEAHFGGKRFVFRDLGSVTFCIAQKVTKKSSLPPRRGMKHCTCKYLKFSPHPHEKSSTY